MIKQKFITLLAIMLLGITSCTISPTSGQYAVEEDFFSGEVTVHNGPGMADAMNMMDDVEYYDKEDMYSFSHDLAEGAKKDESIYVKFADFGEAMISGTVRYAVPTNDSIMRILHERYDSQQGIENGLIRQAIERAVYLSGPLMTSQESNGSKRAYLLDVIMDQAQNGVFKVKTRDETIIDLQTGKEKTVKVSLPVECESGPRCVNGYVRTETSPLREYQIRLYNFTIKRIKYSGPVEEQIKSQQAMNMAMEEMSIQAKQAQTEAITIVETAKAEVALVNADRDKKIATAQANTAVAKEELEQQKFQAEANLVLKRAEAKADELKVAAGLSPERAAYWKYRSDSVVSANASQALVPMIINASSSSEASGLQQQYGMERAILLIDQLKDRK